MKNILLFGAGKSAFTLVKYLVEESLENGWTLTIADLNASSWKKWYDTDQVELLDFNMENDALKNNLIEKSNLVISMLPAFLHPQIAKSCLHYAKNLITPSYISPEMKAFDEEAKSKGLLFLN